MARYKWNKLPRQPFSRTAIALGARVGHKLNAKIWDDEYIDFGFLLSLQPSPEGYFLSLAPSGMFSAQPQLTLEPGHAPKKIHYLNQWLTTFNTFVALYVERSITCSADHDALQGREGYRL